MTVTARQQRRKSAPRPDLKAIVDFAVASHARATMVLLAVALLGFLPGIFSIPPIDRDEARFAQATKQMVETGDYIDIRFQDEVRYKKPAGIYWLQAGCGEGGERTWRAGRATTIGLYRLPSVARRHRRGPADLLGGARVRFPARRLACRLDDGELRAPRRRATPGQDRRHVAADGRCRHGRDGARLILQDYGSAPMHRCCRRMADRGRILDGDCRRRPA